MKISATAKLQSLKWHQKVFGIFILALFLRLVPLLLFSATQIADAQDYHTLAVALASGDGFSTNGQPTAYRPIGYPLFLAGIYALFGVEIGAAQFTQSLLGALSCVLLAVVGRFWYSERIGLLASLGLALYPESILYSQLLMTEVLYVFLFLLGIWLATLGWRTSSWKRGLVSGLIVGAMVLVRPVALVLLGVIPFCDLSTLNMREFFRRVCIVCIGCAVLVTPWMARNWLVLGQPVLATNGGVDLWIGNNPHATGRYNWSDEMRQQILTGNDEIENDRIAREAALTYIFNDFGRFMKAGAVKLAYYFGLEATSVNWLNLGGDPIFAKPIIRVAMFAGVNIGYIVLVALALLALATAGRSTWSQHTPFLMLLAASILPYTIFFGESRFHYPIIPLLMLLGAVGITKAYLFFRNTNNSWSSRLRWRSLAVWGALMALFIVSIIYTTLNRI